MAHRHGGVVADIAHVERFAPGRRPEEGIRNRTIGGEVAQDSQRFLRRAASEAPAAAGRNRKEGAKDRTMKILIAEDDQLSNFVLTTRLRKLGYEVIPAEDGREGWALYRSERPDIVITDWMMPNIDGLELTRMIRADHRPEYPYIIILTALSGKGSIMEGMSAGADDFVTKPYDIELLTGRFRVAERMLTLHTEVNQLRGLLPVCVDCRKIQAEDHTWLPLDAFIAARSEISFCTTKCPECEQKGKRAAEKGD